MNFISPGGPIILMEAINYGLIEIVNFLLESGADPNIPDEVIITISLLLLSI